MPKFGKKSKVERDTLDPYLQQVLNRAIRETDFSILEGARTAEKQAEYFAKGVSKLDGVTKKSKHQVTEEQPLSRAVDVAPYPINFSGDEEKELEEILEMSTTTPNSKIKAKAREIAKIKSRFYYLAGVIITTFYDLREPGPSQTIPLNVSIRWGGDWDGDGDFFDQSFDDLGHFEIIYG